MGEILKSNFWELLQLVNTAEKSKKGKDPGWEEGFRWRFIPNFHPFFFWIFSSVGRGFHWVHILDSIGRLKKGAMLS